MNTATVPVGTESETLMKKNILLQGGGYFSLAFAVFQISGPLWPPHVIKYFGGPGELSRTRPVDFALLCIVIAVIVAIFGLYALSGAGIVRRLPLLRTVITATTAIYLLRGLLLVPQILLVSKYPGVMRFALYSVIALGVGLVHLGGLIKLFKQGRPGEAAAKS